jgi:hypothetical protein
MARNVSYASFNAGSLSPIDRSLASMRSWTALESGKSSSVVSDSMNLDEHSGSFV